MERFKLFTLAVILPIMCYSSEHEVVLPDNSLIEYTGRIDFANPVQPKFSYSGVSIRACFQGTSISVILNDEGNRNQYYAILNNEIVKRFQTSGGLRTYGIANGLKDTIHEIEIFRLTEDMFGKTEFRGFLIDQGRSLVDIINKRNLLFEFIGNSITCGYGNEGKLGQTFGPETQNHYMTYAAITSRSFNARHLAVCKSGIGVYRNYNGPVEGNADCMANFYPRVNFSDPVPLYSFGQKPDLICINLGTNDFSVNKGDSALFVSNYLRLIDSVQVMNNNADILCLLGSMLSGNDLNRVRAYITHVVNSASSRNNGNVYFFEMSEQTGSLGIDGHPTIDQHIKNAKELIEFIHSIYHWPIQPIALSGEILSAYELAIEFNTAVSDPNGSFDGLSVTSNGTSIPLLVVAPDKSDSTRIHLHLAAGIQVGEMVAVSYSPGSIAGKGDILLDNISSLGISNTLTKTFLSNAFTNNEGNMVTLVFNKDLHPSTNLDGLILFDSNHNPLSIHSFSIILSEIIISLDSNISEGDSIFVTILSDIFGNDRVELKPVEGYLLINNSQHNSDTNTFFAPHKPMDRFTIFPNPSGNRMVNYLVSNDYSDKYVVFIYDLQGGLITTRVLNGSKGTLDLSEDGLKSGTYILRLIARNEVYKKVLFLQ
jgi:hypothetical protein